jgi:hypothetical protein
MNINIWGAALKYKDLLNIRRDTTTSILKLSTPSSLAVNFFFLFQPNAHNTLDIHIYHLLPLTCFGVSYTIFREITALLSQELDAFSNVVYIGYARKCKVYPVFFKFTMLYAFRNFFMANFKKQGTLYIL